jgi:small conductance mechanosensitive channel
MNHGNTFWEHLTDTGAWLLGAAQAPEVGAVAQASAWKDKAIDYLLQNGPKLIGAFLIVVGGLLAARWLGGLMMRWLEKRQLEPPVRMLITRIGKLLVIGFAIVIALGTIGFNIMVLVTGFGVAGVGVGLAMQGVLGNLVAGLLIIFTKPFRVGEYIALLGVEGQVDTIELFSTTLRHPDLSRVVIPNRRIVGEILHNHGTVRQLDLAVGVAYDTDLSRALAVVQQAVQQSARVLKEPVPVIGIRTPGDSSIEIAFKPWVKVQDYPFAGAELYKAVIERLRAEHISIPFPQREVRMLSETGPRVANG